MEEFSSVIGVKKMSELGALFAPTPEARAGFRRMSPAQTCVPKGIFKYRIPQAANVDWDRRQVDAIKANINLRDENGD